MSRVLSAAAAVLLGEALQISEGQYHPGALALAVAAGLLALGAALCGRAGGPPRPHTVLLIQATLGSGALLGLAATVLGRPLSYAAPHAIASLRGAAVLALGFLAAYLCVHLRASLVRVRFAGLLLVFVALGVAAVRLSPRPWIDTWLFQQIGAEALLGGTDPYAVGYPDLYAQSGFDQIFYSPELLRDGQVIFNPYPPLTLLAAAAGRAVLGDVRYLSVAALAGGAWALARAGGPGGSTDPRRITAELAAVFVLFQPRTLFVVEQAWTEPQVLFAYALFSLLLARMAADGGGALLVGLAGGLLISAKQVAPLLFLPLWLSARAGTRGRILAVALIFVAMLAVPFLIWGAEDFVRGALVAPAVLPFRPDALSLLVPLAHLGLPSSRVLAALGFAAAAVALLVALPLRRAPSLAQAAMAAAAAWLWFVLLNKQSFCNYLWLAAALLAAAAAREDREALA